MRSSGEKSLSCKLCSTEGWQAGTEDGQDSALHLPGHHTCWPVTCCSPAPIWPLRHETPGPFTEEARMVYTMHELWRTSGYKAHFGNVILHSLRVPFFPPFFFFRPLILYYKRGVLILLPHKQRRLICTQAAFFPQPEKERRSLALKGLPYCTHTQLHVFAVSLLSMSFHLLLKKRLATLSIQRLEPEELWQNPNSPSAERIPLKKIEEKKHPQTLPRWSLTSKQVWISSGILELSKWRIFEGLLPILKVRSPQKF